jgi:hypothetical protein
LLALQPREQRPLPTHIDRMPARGRVVLLTERYARKAITIGDTLSRVGQVEPLVLDVADTHTNEKAAA